MPKIIIILFKYNGFDNFLWLADTLYIALPEVYYNSNLRLISLGKYCK